jgi:hypothetical protein
VISPEIHVMLSPMRAYAVYAPAHTRSGLWIAIRRPLFVALLLGVAIAMTATHTVAAPVVVSVTLCWSVAVVIQLVTALIVVGPSSRRTVPMSRALDLFFLGHAPWSLWLLAVGGMATWTPDLVNTLTVVLTMLVPAALTTRIVAAFSAVVLGNSRRAAVTRAALHHAITWIAIILLFAAAVALWPRVLAVLP